MFLEIVKKVVSSSTLRQLAMVAGKTAIVCGIVAGTSVVAQKIALKDQLEFKNKMMGTQPEVK